MTIDTIVTDPALLSFLQISQAAREQALSLADRLAADATLTTEDQLELSKEQRLLNTNLAHLRGLHRAAYFSARETKTQTAEARQEVDRLHLQLQNLYYEQRHLQGEIAACESYELVDTDSTNSQSLLPNMAPSMAEMEDIVTRFELRKTASSRSSPKPNHLTATDNNILTHSHEYQKLPLVPIEEFLAKHPEHADADENTLMVARIEDERVEREALEQQRQELLKRKAKLIADNKKRREDLANLDKDLEKFIDVRLSGFDCEDAIANISLRRRRNRFRRRSKKSSDWGPYELCTTFVLRGIFFAMISLDCFG